MSERGYKAALAALRSDLEFERLAVRRYADLAKRLDDPVLKEAMRALARAESGHVRGLKEMLVRVEGDAWPALFFCPVCGWQLDLGLDPSEDAVVICPMCSVSFTLSLHEGDFVLTQAEV
jgi:rubrerythrin